jgi:uncharacterized OB-fold protein
MTANITEFPGVYLKEQDFVDGRVLFTEWNPNAQFNWDTGVAIGRYLAELKEGRLTGVRCEKCRRTVIPPRTVCEWCFRPMDSWLTLPDTGTVNTFSLCYVTWDMKYLEEPEIPAVIDIDGTSPPAGIMHRLGEVDTETLRIGMRVQAVWKPAEQRTGSILDIEYFKPVQAAGSE